VIIREALRQAELRLAQLPHAEPVLEASLLLCEVLERPRTYLIAWPDRDLESAPLVAFEALVERRRRGEPIAHILGRREFWSLSLEVTDATLIPRPDTELLVERALALIPKDASWLLADLGTGSGAVAAALAVERPGCRIIASDVSGAALEVAGRNFRRLRLDRVYPRFGPWWEPCDPEDPIDLAVSNPPYVAEGDPHLALGDLPHEPREALAAGPDGLDDLRRIASGASRRLRPGGWLLLEHGFDQGSAVRSLLKDAGLDEIETYRDFSGHERVTRSRARKWKI